MRRIANPNPKGHAGSNPAPGSNTAFMCHFQSSRLKPDASNTRKPKTYPFFRLCNFLVRVMVLSVNA